MCIDEAAHLLLMRLSRDGEAREKNRGGGVKRRMNDGYKGLVAIQRRVLGLIWLNVLQGNLVTKIEEIEGE